MIVFFIKPNKLSKIMEHICLWIGTATIFRQVALERNKNATSVKLSKMFMCLFNISQGAQDFQMCKIKAYDTDYLSCSIILPIAIFIAREPASYKTLARPLQFDPGPFLRSQPQKENSTNFFIRRLLLLHIVFLLSNSKHSHVKRNENKYTLES